MTREIPLFNCYIDTKYCLPTASMVALRGRHIASTIIVLALCCVLFIVNTASHLRAPVKDSEIKVSIPCSDSHCIVPADDVRKTLNQKSGIFLGTGLYPKYFDNLSLVEAQMLFHGTMLSVPYKCNKIKRYGNKGDGGYDVCLDDRFAPQKNNCLVYSFGIRNEWSFDDAINTQHGCEVHSFDPSMNQKDHMHREPNMYFHNLGIWSGNLIQTRYGMDWQLKNLATIIKQLKHERRIIDYLKVDVEGAEWPLISHIITSGVHKQIRQMALELHTPRLNADKESMTVTDYGEIHHGLTQLGQLGFKKFIYHASNGCCGRFVELTPPSVAKRKLCCYEGAYVNVNL